MMCPDCKTDTLFQYQDEYDTIFVCSKCRQLFDVDVFKDKRDI